MTYVDLVFLESILVCGSLTFLMARQFERILGHFAFQIIFLPILSFLLHMTFTLFSVFCI